MSDVLRGLLLTSAAVGLAASAAALYGRYRTLPAFLTGPNVCRLEQGGCAVLFRTPAAAILGVPNALLGALYYPLLAAAILRSVSPTLLFAASLLPLGVSAVLARILLRDRLECRICWAGHAANLAITLALGAVAALQK